MLLRIVQRISKFRSVSTLESHSVITNNCLAKKVLILSKKIDFVNVFRGSLI
jgi:hypothetical protein